MKLESILKGYEFQVLKGSLDVEITNIENDSRKIEKGNLFVAEKGFTLDGHDYINTVVDLGASAIIVEHDIVVNGDVTVIKVDSSQDALARISNAFYGESWKKLKMLGITGTNGKTSVSYYIKSIFEKNQDNIGVIGTIGAVIGDKKIELKNTTPNALTVHRLFKSMVDNHTDLCVMEVSSHALDFKRVEYVDFETGVFLNLSKDHLDHHKTMENYFNSKKKLFSKTTKYNIINIDDEYGKRIIDEVQSNMPLITFGIYNDATIYATDIKYSLSKVKFTLNTPVGSADITLNVPGEFSVYNGLAAAATAYSYGVALEKIKEGLEAIEGVKGRFEVVPTNTDYTVIIDFAHTADGLDKVLTVIDKFAEGRKVVLFGAGGNRDKTKRPEMGEVVAKHADLCIVTSDNPRFEKPEDIIEDVIVGVEKINGNYIKIVDRIEAIKYAIDNAQPKDIILLAGKGHETYTILNGETYPCDERQIVLDHLQEKNK